MLSRPLNQNQQADARLIARVLPEMGKYIPGRGIFHYATGPYWPARLRRFADLYEKAVPVLRRMADHMENPLASEETGWLVGTQLGNQKQFYNDAWPDWLIYEQTEGFYVWREFHFHSKHASFEEAEAAVKGAA